MPNVCSREQLQKAAAIRMLLAAHTRAEDLIQIGAYQKGSDPVLDKAITALPEIERFLRQTPEEAVTLPEILNQLHALPA